ncbi:unnamed protein product [Colias eurytheme]|nr:unnamed protein product [Colias eurytheme]
MEILSIICVFSLISNAYSAQVRVDPLVLIDQGLVRGLKSSDANYSQFLGIPYAQVDLDNPFGAARHHPGFDEEIFNAYDDSIVCPQTVKSSMRSDSDANETLDCLRLNIYVPTIASSQNPLPVLVWFHGGMYVVGSANSYDPENLVRQGIVVVTVNYRLGPYGFMCLDVPNVPGNQGLKDQYEALTWVRRNIRAFGGNPYNVTVGGQSAGAGSALLHLYSNKDKLFSKVIAQSGTPHKPGSFVNADVDVAKKLALHLGFNTTDTSEALEFLKGTHHKLVSGAAADLDLKLRPCKERSFSGVENFIDTDPFSLSNAKKVKGTPILIGHTSNEYHGTNANEDDEYYKLNIFFETLKESFYLNNEQMEEAALIAQHFYIGDESISRDLSFELDNFSTDFLMKHPIERTTTNLLKENAKPVYQYEFSYVGDSEKDDAVHNEVKYLFNFGGTVEGNEKNKLLIARITKMWANFVKYGDPTPVVDDILPVKWKSAGKDYRPYMIIDADLKLEYRINKESMAFWDLFYKAYGHYNIYTRDCSF